MSNSITFRQAEKNDLPILEEIRQKAFAPIFTSFRNILGDRIYSIAQEPEDNRQDELLSSMFSPGDRMEDF